MDTARWKRLQSLFFDVLDAETDERATLVEQGTRDDLDFRRDLLAMLRAHEESMPLRIEQRLFTARRAAGGDLEGERLGAYQVRREIGRGGMGTVYLAERVDQYRQQVAIKILTSGLLGRELEERFRRERQILAQLAHPNIASILDGGMTDDGRPYLVMPYVDGQPITSYCDSAEIGLRQRLELFRTVCDAVHHAHRNLVVHRDLKPSNILVTAEGEVMLLDFGIAKLLDADAGTSTEATRSELRLMTPEHAAPEQVLDQPITTATDTWALGVLLYELITGVRPFSKPGASRLDLEVAICEHEPTPPSQAVRRLDAEDDDPRRGWSRQLAGDLDTIVLHALDKVADRRYSSAEQMAEDVRRHLVGEPVRARPATFGYRAGRFLRRNAWQVASITALTSVLAAFAVTGTMQSRALQRERDMARLERDTAEQVTDVLVDLFETTQPSRLPGSRSMTVDDLLRVHSDRVVAGLDGQDAVQARMRHILGNVHRSHSRFDEAHRLLLDALRQQVAIAGWDDPTTLRFYHDLAIQEADFGQRAHGLRMLRHSLDLHRALLGEDHERIPQCLETLAGRLPPASPERSALLVEALERRRRLEPIPSIGTAETLNNLGLARLAELRLGDALDRFDQSYELLLDLVGESHPFALAVLGNRASTLTSMNRFQEAERVSRQLVERVRDVYGETSVEVAKALNNLGTALAGRGAWAEAEAVLAESLELSRSLVGPDHPSLDNTTRNLAWVVQFQGRFADAQALLRPLVADGRAIDPRDAVLTKTQLAGLRLRRGEVDAAIESLEAIVEGLDSVTPHPDPILANAPRSALAEAYLVAGRPADAERLFRGVLDQLTAEHDPSPPSVAHARCGAAAALAGQGRDDEARPLFASCLEPFTAWGWANPATLALFREAAAAVEARAD